MGKVFWSHSGGFRSPTEQQLNRWEMDGGGYSDLETAELCDGRLYTCKLRLTKARLGLKMAHLLSSFSSIVPERARQATTVAPTTNAMTNASPQVGSASGKYFERCRRPRHRLKSRSKILKTHSNSVQRI